MRPKNLGSTLVALYLSFGTPVMAQQAAPATQAQSVPVDPKQQFANSLTLRAERIVVDPAIPSIAWLTQTSPAVYRPSNAMKLKLSLYVAPPPQAAPGGNAPPSAPVPADSKPVRDLGTSDLFPRDIAVRPVGVSVDLRGVADGNYRVVAQVLEGDSAVARLEQSIWLADGIQSKLPDIQQRLEKIQGHESTKATILYPFDYARIINIGRRSYASGQDIGLDEQDKPDYFKFGQWIKNSESLLAALESGKDPLWQAKGDMKRHYWFADGDEIMPYRVFVPPSWDGKSPLPLVFILHGNTRNQDFYFDRSEQLIPKTAEKYGYMLVAVYGYHPNGGYNYGTLNAAAGGRGGGGRGGAAFGPASAGRGGRGGGGFMNGLPSTRLGELSEADTMKVYDLIHKEYPIDPKRTFLFGYSAGGNGGYYIGAKYAENWRAIALGGANAPSTIIPFDRIKDTPFMIEYGEKDSAGVVQASKNMVQAMKDHGIEAELVELKGEDHNTGVAAGTPYVFDFFNRHGGLAK